MELLRPFFPSESLLKLEFLIDEKKTGLDSLLKEASISFELNKIPTAKFTFISQQLTIDPNEKLPTDILKTENADKPREIEVKISFEKESITIFKGIVKAFEKQNDDNQIVTKIECKDYGFNLTLPTHVENNNEDFTTKLDCYTNNAKLKLELTTGSWGQEKLVHNAAISPWDYLVGFLDSVGMLVALRNGIFKGIDITNDLPKQAKYLAQNGVNVFSFTGKKSPEKIKSDVVLETWDYEKQEIVKFEAQQNAQKNHQSIKVEAPQYKSDTYKKIVEATSKKSVIASFSGKISTFGNLKAKAGEYIEFKDVNDQIDKETLLITQELHTIENGCWKTEYSFGLESEKSFSESTTSGVNNSQAQVGQSNTINGLQIGVVTQIEEDPNNQFRVKVRIPLLSENGEGIWARLATLNASNDMGSYFIPDVNDEVIIGCLGNNPDTPIILGSLYSSNKPMPYPIAQNNYIKGFVTKEGTKIIMDDEKKVIELSTKKGNKLTISDDLKGFVIEDENKNKITMNDKGITIESAKDINMKAKGNIKIQGVQIDAEASGNMTLKGAMINLN